MKLIKNKMYFLWLILLLIPICTNGTLVMAEELTIDEVIELALKENPTLKNLSRDIESSGLNLEKYNNAFYPKVEINGDTGLNHTFSREDVDTELKINLKPSLNWLLTPDTNLTLLLEGYSYPDSDSGFGSSGNSLSVKHLVFGGDGTWESGLRSQKLAYLSAEIQLQEQRSSIIYQIIKNYYDVIKCMKLIEVQNKALFRSEDHLKKVEAFFEVGQVSKLDLLNAQVQVNQDRSALKRAENALALAKMQLELIVGSKIPDNFTFNSKIKIQPFSYIEEDVVQMALENCLKLSLLYQQLEVQKEEYQRLQNLKLPDIYLQGNYQWRDWNEGEVSITVQATYQPFEGCQVQYDLDKNLLEQEKLQELIQTEKNRLRVDIQSKFLNLAASMEELKAQEVIIQKYADNLEIAKFRYEAGITNDSEVLELQVGLSQAEKTYYERMVDYQLTVIELSQLIGEQF